MTYVIVRHVEGLPAGLYHYAVKEHALHRLRAGKGPGDALAANVPQARLVERAPVTFVFTSVFHRVELEVQGAGLPVLWAGCGSPGHSDDAGRGSVRLRGHCRSDVLTMRA